MGHTDVLLQEEIMKSILSILAVTCLFCLLIGCGPHQTPHPEQAYTPVEALTMQAEAVDARPEEKPDRSLFRELLKDAATILDLIYFWP